jgi:hypothetical protein
MNRAGKIRNLATTFLLAKVANSFIYKWMTSFSPGLNRPENKADQENTCYYVKNA